jgi:hypothetical protein
VSGEQGYGVAVDTDSVLAALNPTRPLRHALDVLWDNMPGDMLTDAIRAAFFEIAYDLTIMSSSYETASAIAGHAATATPVRPWPRPCATFAVSVAVMRRPRSHRATQPPPRRQGPRAQLTT